MTYKCKPCRILLIKELFTIFAAKKRLIYNFNKMFCLISFIINLVLIFLLSGRDKFEECSELWKVFTIFLLLPVISILLSGIVCLIFGIEIKWI